MSVDPQVEKQVPWSIIIVIILFVVVIAAWLLLNEPNEPKQEVTPVVEPVIEEVVEPIVEPEPLEEVFELPETTVEEVPAEPIKPTLPDLDQSDNIVIDKLDEITWRKELLKLVVTDDIIRRFVVFTDNFSQGNLSYDHSPFTAPTEKFRALESIDEQTKETHWFWDESSSRRFSLYVDLLRSVDSETLVSFYVEIKPLIDQAYQELGYPDQDFTDILQIAITRVLDLDLPNQLPELSRPSVMYKYQDEDLEALDDAEKLLLRLGKENVLVIKSVLLEINDKLSRVNNG